jgi:hypothetical protein
MNIRGVKNISVGLHKEEGKIRNGLGGMKTTMGGADLVTGRSKTTEQNV